MQCKMCSEHNKMTMLYLIEIWRTFRSTWGKVLCFFRERRRGAFLQIVQNLAWLVAKFFIRLSRMLGWVWDTLIARWLDCQKVDSMRIFFWGIFPLSPYLWLKAYILKCVYALCVLCFIFFTSTVVKASFLRVREHIVFHRFYLQVYK